jgi:hypothetical protein
MAILGLALPPAAWISSAAIVLVTLVFGGQRGFTTIVISVLGAALFAYLIFAAPQVVLMFVVFAWLPAWLAAIVLRQTVSLAYSLQVLTVMGLLAVAMVYSLFPDIGELWREPLDQLITQLAEQSTDLSLAELKQTEDWVIAFIPGLLVSSIMFGTMLSLLLGRWWQAVFYNPGGFAKEFQSLNLGKVSALAALATVLLATYVDSVMVLALAAVVSLLYSMQALSLLHAAVNIRQMKSVWLFVVYVIMFFVPHLLLLLILASFVDPWLDLRGRLRQAV